jgi:large subunit ribosomal protein L23
MNQERLYTVLLGPHISEKAAIGAEDANQFVFKVAVDASKLEIKKAVEKLFNVKVVNVQTVLNKGKVKRNRYGFAKRPNTKKAYVRLEQGHEIDFAVVE